MARKRQPRKLDAALKIEAGRQLQYREALKLPLAQRAISAYGTNRRG